LHNGRIDTVVDQTVHCTPAESQLLWRRLWELRDLAPVVAMLRAAATSACPLLADERAVMLDVGSHRAIPADPRYADLVPLISRASIGSFLREVDISRWNACEFRGFHERIGALLRRKSDVQAIAKPV